MALTLKADDKFRAFMSGLPEVSSTDNGQVLTVVEGAWAKAAPSGGGGGSIVLVGLDQLGTGIDMSYAEIETALLAGSTVWFHYSLSDGETVTAENYYPLAYVGREYDTHDLQYNYLVVFGSGSEQNVCISTDKDADMTLRA
jgi:hypothetical protein